MSRSTRVIVLFCLAALPLAAATPQLPVGGFGSVDSFAPQIAADGSGFFLTWLEYDDTLRHRLYGSRVARDGRLLDGGGVLLSTDDPTASRVKFDGTHYVVAIATQRPGSDGTYLRVLFISPATGTVVRDVSVPDAHGYDLALEVSTTATFLAWLDQDATIQLARISHATGIVERTSLPFTGAGYPALSWNGSSLLVAWNTMRVIVGSPVIVVPEAVHAARVSETLALLDTTPLLLETLEAAQGMEESAPSAASDGQEWLVTWGYRSSIRATRISADGLRGDVAEIARGEAPLVVRNGDRYALAWNEAIPATGTLRMLLVADIITANGRIGTSSPVIAGVADFFGQVSSVAGGSHREIGIAWQSASAPRFDWQASFRILDPSTSRRRSVRVSGP